MKMYDVCGLGNALVDVLVDISEDELLELGYDKGTMHLVETKVQQELLGRYLRREPKLVSGGSIANSIIAAAQLGAKGALICCLGDDVYGLHYQGEFRDLGVELGVPAVAGQPTGTCVSLVTPDAERTMRTCLAVSSEIAAPYVREEVIAQSKWLFIEGYLFANGDKGLSAIDAAVTYAKKNNCKVALTVSEPWVAQSFAKDVQRVLDSCDLVFTNEKEAAALAGRSTPQEAFEVLRQRLPAVVVTAGPDGAFVSYGGESLKVGAFPCTPVDLTGAGDMFAGSFLYGISCALNRGLPLETLTRASNFLAMKVITQVGARLQSGAREPWDEVMSKAQ